MKPLLIEACKRKWGDTVPIIGICRLDILRIRGDSKCELSTRLYYYWHNVFAIGSVSL